MLNIFSKDLKKIDAEKITEINTIDEMEAYLKHLQKNSSESISSALSAQLQVIAIISSPQLIDSTFDLFFANVKKSIKYSPNEHEREIMKEKTHVIINNFIFFQNAKLEYLTQDNKKNGEKLLQEAAEMFAETALDLALSGNAKTIKVVVKNLSQSIIKKSKESGFFPRVVEWYNKKEKQKIEEKNFTLVIDSILQKVDYHKEIIGKSDITAGLVRRWTERLIQHQTFNSLADYNRHQPAKSLSLLLKIIIALVILLLGFSIITTLYDYFALGLKPFQESSVTSKMWSVGKYITIILTSMLVFSFIISLIIDVIKYKNYTKQVLERKKHYKALENSFYE